MSQNLSQHDRIVVVMGPTGSGKSTFINCATRQDGLTIGHNLRPQRIDIRTVKCTHPNDGYPVVFVDTPGFDGPSQSDVEILGTIADFFVQTYKEKTNLTTIIYLHKINDNRMTGSILKNLQTFKSLCGKKAMPNVIIATTMWGKVDADEGAEREKELKTDFWADMTGDGCKTGRFENTAESAWHVIDSPPGNDRARIQLSSEMVDNGRPLEETEAGIHVHEAAFQGRELKALRKRLRRLLSRVHRTRNANGESSTS